MPIFFNFRRRQSEVSQCVGILDQISILRSPATADLKQDQYSTILVQLAERGLPTFTTLARGPSNAGLQQRVSLPTARKLKNHPCVGSRNQ